MSQLQTTGRGIKLEKAYFTKVDGGDPIPVMFNPETITWNLKLNWKPQEQAKSNAPKMHYMSSEAQTMGFKLQFDTSGLTGGGELNAPDVRQFIAPILELTMPTKVVNTGKDTQKEPPLVVFAWGKGLTFTCVVDKCDVTFQKFNADGTPSRCELSVSLTEAKPGEMMESGMSSSGTVSTSNSDTNAYNASGDSASAYENWRSTVENNPDVFPDGNARRARPGQPMRS